MQDKHLDPVLSLKPFLFPFCALGGKLRHFINLLKSILTFSDSVLFEIYNQAVINVLSSEKLKIYKQIVSVYKLVLIDHLSMTTVQLLDILWRRPFSSSATHKKLAKQVQQFNAQSLQ